MPKIPIVNLSIANTGYLKIGDAELNETELTRLLGLTGSSGSVGNGATGPAGPAGPTGPGGTGSGSGGSGSTGPAGAAGPTGSVGTDGAAGPTGPAGVSTTPGPAGPAGPTGAGVPGPTGDKGDIGAPFVIFQSYTDYNTFLADVSHGNDKINKFAVVIEEGPNHGKLYLYKGNGGGGNFGTFGQWRYVTDISPLPIAGPTGPDGVSNIAGPIGSTGIQGERGHTGAVGPTGLKGEDGNDGPVGVTGPQAGIFQIFKYYDTEQELLDDDTGYPTNVNQHAIVMGSEDEAGRVYVNLGTGNGGNVGYMSQWLYVIDITPAVIPGPAGAAGPTGLQGQDGQLGSDGTSGQDGQDGMTGPEGQDGQDGPRGHTGEKGDDGQNGQDGPTGVPGPQGVTGPPTELFNYAAYFTYADPYNMPSSGYNTGDYALYQGNATYPGAIYRFVGQTNGDEGQNNSWKLVSQVGQGSPGEQGPTGADGKVFKVFDYYASDALLLAATGIADSHINEHAIVSGQTGESNHGKLYVYLGNNNGSTGANGQWKFVFDLSPDVIAGQDGSVGPTGSNGSIGPTGPASSSSIEYMTGSIYTSSSTEIHDKLYIAYGQLNGGSGTVYYMSKVKEPETTNSYRWRYTATNPINDNDTFTVFDDWGIGSPSITSYTSTTITEGQQGVSLTPQGTFLATATYAISTNALPTGLTFTAANGYISGNVGSSIAGTYTYTVTPTNSTGTGTGFTLIITVEALPVPTIQSYTSNPATYSEGEQNISNSPTATSSPTGYAMLPNTLNADTGLAFDTTTGVISGTVGQSTEGTYIYNITASNNNGSGAAYPITININDDVVNPIITYSIGGISSASTTRVLYSLDPVETINLFSNVDSTWTVSPIFPSPIAFNDASVSATKNIIITPQTGQTVANNNYTITATNTDNESATIAFDISINLALPVITGYDSVTNNEVDLYEGTTYSLDPIGDYLTGASNTFTIDRPTGLTNETGLTFNTNTGNIGGVANGTNDVEYTYVVSHINSEGTGNNFTIKITILDATPNPTLVYDPISYVGTVDTALSISPTSISNVTACTITPTLPNGLSINNSGVISGTPTFASISTDYTITASNSDTPADTVAFTIDITIEAAAVSYNGISSVTYIPSTLSGNNYGQSYVGLTTEGTIYFTVKLENPTNSQDTWYVIPMNLETDTANTALTTLSYTNTNTILHYLPSAYATNNNTTTPYDAGALFLANAANSTQYIYCKLPNTSWSPNYYSGGVDYNPQFGNNKFVYRFIQNGTGGLLNLPGTMNTTYTYTSNTECIPQLPINYNDASVKNGLDDGQLFIGRYGDGLYLIVFTNNDYKQVGLNIVAGISYAGNAATYNSDTHWVYPPP